MTHIRRELEQALLTRDVLAQSASRLTQVIVGHEAEIARLAAEVERLTKENEALREVVKAADALRFVPPYEYNERVADFDAARARLDTGAPR